MLEYFDFIKSAINKIRNRNYGVYKYSSAPLVANHQISVFRNKFMLTWVITI